MSAAPAAPSVGVTVPVTEMSPPVTAVTGSLPVTASGSENIIVPETGLIKVAEEPELQPQSQLRLPAATPAGAYGEAGGYGGSGALESPVHGFVVAFFSGGCLVLLLMMIYEFILFYREKHTEF